MSKYTDTVLADGAVHYWTLGESSGTSATDSGPNGNTGTYDTYAVPGSTGAPIPGGTSCYFQGGMPGTVTALSPTGIPLGNSDRTVEFWIKNLDINTSNYWNIGPTNTDRLFAYFSGIGNHDFRVDDGTGRNAVWSGVNSTLADGSWHHLVVTYSNKVFEAWVDGSSQGTRSIASNLATAAGNGVQAGGLYGSATVFYGYGAHFAIYPSVLSATRIAAHYAGGDAGGYVRVTSDSVSALAESLSVLVNGEAPSAPPAPPGPPPARSTRVIGIWGRGQAINVP